MGISVVTNVASLQAQRNLGKTTNNLNKSIEHLYRGFGLTERQMTQRDRRSQAKCRCSSAGSSKQIETRTTISA